jgi:2-deoxy-D-gluconate 3-dehydrogenase
MQATNLRSAFLFCQAAEDLLRRARPGYVVNIASLASFLGGRNIAAYAAAKGGLAQFTKALANEWASAGVHVNAVAPGYVETDANADLRAQDPDRVRHFSERIPAGRWARPEDIVGPVMFLCSGAAEYVHGVVLPVDGGSLGW